MKLFGNQDQQPINTNGTYKFSLLAKIFHWGFALLIVFGIITQVHNINELEDTAKLHREFIFAVFWLLLVFLRFLYMYFRQSTALPKNTPDWQVLAAKYVHYGMYVGLLLIPLTGLLIGMLFSLGFKSGILLTIASGLHVFVINATYWLIGGHVLAAVYHRFLKDGVWDSMVPIWAEKKKQKID